MINVPALEIKETLGLRVLVILLSRVLRIQIMGQAAIAGTIALAFFVFYPCLKNQFISNA